MACNLTHGRGIPCRNLVGGVKYVYFAKKDEITSLTTVGSVITDIEMGTNDLYRYSVRRGNASVTETITGSTENGTVVYAPTVRRLQRWTAPPTPRVVGSTKLTSW